MGFTMDGLNGRAKYRFFFTTAMFTSGSGVKEHTGCAVSETMGRRAPWFPIMWLCYTIRNRALPTDNINHSRFLMFCTETTLTPRIIIRWLYFTSWILATFTNDINHSRFLMDSTVCASPTNNIKCGTCLCAPCVFTSFILHINHSRVFMSITETAFTTFMIKCWEYVTPRKLASLTSNIHHPHIFMN